MSLEPINILLYMAKETADMINLLILRWGDYPGGKMESLASLQEKVETEETENELLRNQRS